MSLETEMKKLGEQISALNDHMSQYLVLSKQGSAYLSQLMKQIEGKTSAPLEKLAEQAPEQEKLETPETRELPPVSRKDLGEYLRNLALKYGDPAQEKMAEVALERAGTQALSQIDERLLPQIMEDMKVWEKVWEAEKK